MGTTFLLVVAEKDAHLLDAAERMVADLERRWSRFLPDSEISILNRTPGVPVIVSADTFTVIRAAVDGSIATGGRFDPTVHDAMVALGYDRTFDEISQSTGPLGRTSHAGNADRACPAPGVDGIELDEALHAVVLPPDTRLDLGGIGKGAAADLVSEWAMAHGAAGIAVSIGGDIRVRGRSPSGGGWSFTHDHAALDLPPLEDGGVCTSTTGRRRWPTPTGDLHHLIDPFSGRPTGSAAGSIASVTVVAATALQAEILTKAAIVAGDDAEAVLAPFGVMSLIQRTAECAAQRTPRLTPS